MKTFNIHFWLSVGLILGGFFSPPIGEISGNVLSAVGFLLMFRAVEKLPEAISSAKNYTIRHGESSIEVTTKDKPTD